MADDALDIADTGFSLILHFDPLMVAELAMGADHPHDIAERYGVGEIEYEHLAAQDWFARLVAQKRTEFHDTGVLFQAKAGMMAEALLTRLFQQAMANQLAAPLTIEVSKQLTDIGRLKPQPLNSIPGSAGGAPFQINIQVNGVDVLRPHKNLGPAPLDVSSTPAGTSGPAALTTVSGDPGAPSGEGKAAGPTHPVLHPTPPAAQTPTLSMSFADPKGTPPTSVSNLKVRDFDLRPNPRPAPGAAAAAFGGGLGLLQGLPTPPKPA